VPVNLRWDRDALAWDPAAKGRKPAKYVVYGSNEKGFTASDTEYKVWAGNQKTGGLYPGQEFVTFPSNRLTETPEPRLRLRPLHAFYRVVAIDEKGQVSGSSDYLAAPRPVITSEPPTRAEPGKPFKYEITSNASIGDVRCRAIDGNLYCAAFWDAEKPVFSLTRGPAWLKMDPNGVLSGTVPAEFKGPVEVEVAVGNDRQRFTLR
jgi:hypothetical protein